MIGVSPRCAWGTRPGVSRERLGAASRQVRERSVVAPRAHIVNRVHIGAPLGQERG
jgi:hypothetical protein